MLSLHESTLILLREMIEMLSHGTEGLTLFSVQLIVMNIDLQDSLGEIIHATRQSLTGICFDEYIQKDKWIFTNLS